MRPRTFRNSEYGGSEQQIVLILTHFVACSRSDANPSDVILAIQSLLAIIKLQRTHLLSSQVLALKNDVRDIAAYSSLNYF